MGNRGAVIAVSAVVAILLGVGGAYVAHNARTGPVAVNSSPSASPSESPSASPSESPSPETSPSPSEAASPAASPTAVPSPTASPAPAGPAAYPQQIKAGSQYSYKGSGTMTVLAADKADVGTSACATIDESTSPVPAGYWTFFYVSIQFNDGLVIAVGYVKSATERHDFATAGSTGNPNAGPTTPGAHTYCLTRTAGKWVASDDGKAIFSTSAGGASTAGASVQFHSSAQLDAVAPAPPAARHSFNLVVPGFHDLSVGGKPPTQLIGQGPLYTS